VCEVATTLSSKWFAAFSTSFVVLVAAPLLFLNLIVAANFVLVSDGNWLYTAGPIVFLTLTVAAPVAAFQISAARVRSTALAIRRGALASVALNLLMLPISIGAMAM
jgi:hypothetical protein